MKRLLWVVVVTMLVAACSNSTSAPSARHATSTTRTTSAPDAPLASAGCSSPHAAVRADETIDVGGTKRSYQLSVPEASAGDHPAPLVVLLHGLGQRGATIETASGLAEEGRREDVIVVTPDASSANGLWQPAAGGPDDTFMNALIATSEASQCVDRARVAIAGFSAGAAFASSYACRNQSRVAALITASFELPGTCTKPEPVLAFHGTSDPIVPYGASAGGGGLGGPGTLANMTRWARTNGCATKPSTTTVNERVRRTTWTHCANGADTELVTIVGGGHAWPEPTIDVERTKSTRRNASAATLQFVIDHPLAVGDHLVSFCAAAQSLLDLTAQSAFTGAPNLAANTALVAGRARALKLAADDTQRNAASHLADAALPATQAQRPTAQDAAAAAAARTTISQLCP